ncbi:hypothetical protein J6590_079002 [Homalodisca vitripennis]|nr:hypothetical protein J6590_079002 [Homalodisca vitripennis]
MRPRGNHNRLSQMLTRVIIVEFALKPRPILDAKTHTTPPPNQHQPPKTTTPKQPMAQIRSLEHCQLLSFLQPETQ